MPLDADLHEVTAAELRSDRHLGQEGRAEAGQYDALAGLGVVELHEDPRRGVARGEEGERERVQVRRGVAYDEAGPGELVDLHRAAPREAMRRRDDHGH